MRNLARCLIAAACAICFAGCIDEEFRLDEVSKEVSVGQGSTTTLPLGYLERKTLGSLLSDDGEEFEWLKVADNGDYSLHFSGEEQTAEVQGINNTIVVPGSSNTVYATYPKFDIIGANYTVDEFFEISVLHDDVVVDGQTVPVVDGLTLKGREDGVLTHNVSYEIPEQVSAIKCLYFNDDDNPYGTPIHVSFKLNNLAAVNNGGHVTVKLIAPEGYELRDEEGNILEQNTYYREKVVFTSEESYVDFVVYLTRISTDFAMEDNVLSVPVELEYHLSFDMLTKSGSVDLSVLPELHVDSQMMLTDADLVLADYAIVAPRTSEDKPDDITVSNLPAELKSLSSIAFKQGEPLHLAASGYDVLSDSVADVVNITARFPDTFGLRAVEGENYVVEGNNVMTTLKNLRDGVDIYLETLTFDGGVAVTDGEIGLSFSPEVEIYFTEGTLVKLSEIWQDNNYSGTIVVSTVINDVSLDMDAVCGVIDYAYVYEEELTIEGIDDDLELEIVGTGLSPVLAVSLENPLTMTAFVDAELTPKRDGVANESARISLEDLCIAPATVEEGEVVNSRMEIIIASEEHRAEYTDPKYTFVACDVTKLIEGKLLDAIDIKVALQTDASQEQTLYIKDNYLITYAYSFNVPLAFDKGLGILYADSFDGLNDTFSEVADIEGIEVGDVALIVDMVNTLPLNLALDAEFLDKQGNPTQVRLNIPDECIILGSEDGVSEARSEVRLELEVPDGDIRAIADVDTIALSLTATGAADERVSLNANQYFELNIKLELRNGVTVDIDKLTK